MLDIGLKKLSINFSQTFGRQLGVSIINFVVIIIIAKNFGPEGNGIYALAILLPSLLASFLNLGIAPANVYFIGSSKVSVKNAWRSNLRLFFLLSSIGLFIGAFLIITNAEELFPGLDSNILWVSLLIYPAKLLNNFISSLFQGLQKFKIFNLLIVLQPVCTFLLILLMLIFGIANLMLLVIAYLVGILTSLTFGTIYLRKEIEEEVFSVNKEDENYLKESVTYGYKSHLSNILSFINYKADIFIINFFIGPGPTGIYVIAVQLSEKLWLTSKALSTVLLPRLSELNNDEEKRKKITPLICRWTLISTFTASLVLALISYPAIQFIFGAAYLTAVTPLLLLLPGIVTGAGSKVLANDIASRNRPDINMYVSIFIATSNVILNIILVPKFGINGAAVATSITYMFNFILKSYYYSILSGNKVLSLIIFDNDDFEILRAIKKSISRKIKNRLE